MNYPAVRAGCVVVGLVLSACGRSQLPGGPEPALRPNLLLISIDTLRADHLGCYGAKRPTSPRLDRFASSAVRFEHAYAPAPWTLPSHAALLTGVHPYRLGMRDNTARLPSDVPTLAERLAEAGYQTAAIVDSRPGGYVGAARGFDRGFDEYLHHPGRGTPGSSPSLRDDVAVTVASAEAWLDRRDRKRPFFLFLHTKSVHAVPSAARCFDERCFPYDKPDPYRFRFLPEARATATWRSAELGSGQAFLWAHNREVLAGRRSPGAVTPPEAAQLEALYDAGVAYVDEHLGRFLERAEGSGLLAGTTVVITSDHGEAFGEHGLFMHQQVYEELLRVPLVVRLPGAARGRVEGRLVVLEDVAVTLAALAGLEARPPMTGRPLPLSETEPGAAVEADEPFFAYYLFGPRQPYRAFAVARGDLKLVAHTARPQGELDFELYDLRADPAERSPLATADPRLPELRALLERLLRQPPIGTPASLAAESGGGGAIEALPYIE